MGKCHYYNGFNNGGLDINNGKFLVQNCALAPLLMGKKTLAIEPAVY
jgi:hypothetical protein